MRFAWQAQWFRALWCRCLKPSTQNPWKGCKFQVTEVLLGSDHFAWQLQEFVCLGSTFSWQAQYFWSIHLKIIKTYWNCEVKRLVDMSFLKEVSQKSFVFDLQSFVFGGSPAEKLRFWSSKLRFWRKSRRKASFFISKACILKEVSQKSFVFELQSFNFKGSLAEMRRFGASKLHFWRKSRRKALFFELHSFNFEGSLAEMLGFWSSKLQFWRKSRRKASFLSFTASILKEVSQKSFVFELQSSIREGSLAESFFLVASKLQSSWQPNHLNLQSFDIQITWILNSIDTQLIWISNRLTTKSLQSQINCKADSLESQINWHPHHLKFKSTDNQNHLKHTSIDNHIIWISFRLKLTSIDFRTTSTPHTPFL